MDRIGKLNRFADDNDIGIFYKNIPGIKSFSIPGAVVLDTDLMYHPGKEEVALAYGLGSCYYENFYTENDSALDRRRAHVKNCKFAIRELLPHEVLMEVVEAGYTNPVEIAGYLNLPVRFVAASCFYDQNGYMMPDYLLDEYPDEVPGD